MRFSYNWLGDYVDLSAVTASELAQRLTAAGHAVEGTENAGDDVVMDLDVTTNRPDCMNHLGVAREVAVLLDRPLTLPDIQIDEAPEAASDATSIAVDEEDLCPRLVALVIRDVEVGPSPEWLRARLEAIGLRSINNIVDVTNYVLWETGQPLHAYDLDRLAGSEIRVRRARAGEELITLDGERRQLDPDILVISDGEAAVGLAGIMGGLDSEVTDRTRHVLLESAHFEARTVRRGAKKLRMHTDASHRFERGTDPEACLRAARRAAALIAELTGGRVLAGALDLFTPRPQWSPRVEMELAALDRFAGVETPARELERILTGLGFELEEYSSGSYRVTVPSWRYSDFADPYPADVFEEVLRIRGLEVLQSTLPTFSGSDGSLTPAQRLRRKVQDTLAGFGFAETINFAFHDRQADATFPSLYGEASALEIENPLSDLYTVMRRSLLPGLVESALYNQRRGLAVTRLFEIGHIFCHAEEVLEDETVGIVLGGTVGMPWEQQVELDFYHAKGIVDGLAEALSVDLCFRPARTPHLVAGATAEVMVAETSRRLGFLAQLEAPDSHFPLFVAELLLAPLLEVDRSLETRAPSKFPGIVADLTLTHRLEVSWQQVAQVIRDRQVEDLVEFGLKDRYVGPGVPQGAVNTTLFFLYNSDERSLTQEEVNEHQSRLAKVLTERFAI